MKKLLLWTGIIVATVAAILLGMNAYFVWKTGSRLEAQLAELRAAGDPIALKDLARPPIPPEKNAATYLQRAHSDVVGIETELIALFPRGSYENGPIPSAKLDKVQKVFDAYPKAIPLLEKAAACPEFDPQLDYTVPAGVFIANYLPPVQERRAVARVLRARTTFLLAKRRGDDALAGMVLLLRLSRHFDRDPTLVGSLMGMACRGMAIEGANVVLQSESVGKEARHALDHELSQYDAVRAYVETLRTERAYGLDMLRELPWNRHWLLRGISYAAQSRYLDRMREVVEAASRPYYEVKLVNRPVPRWPWGGPKAIADLAVTALDRVRIALENDRALVRCLRVLNAIQSKAAPNAKEPPKLADLGLPPEVTTDPFDGKPLRVKKLPQGWLVYSVGENRIDDGGVLDGKRTDVGLAPPGYARKAEKK